ncbi:MAG: hypothetical protein RTU63_06025 [Candidatus Thorarchaeota archaeon]
MSEKEWRPLDKYAELIMVLATLVPPFMTIFYGLDGRGIYVAVTALFWAIFPPVAPASGFQILDGHWIQGSLPLGFFNIVFAFQVIRYIRGKSGKRKTLAVGVMTLVVPLIAFFFYLRYMIINGFFVYIGPIPIQLVIGLILMRSLAPEEPTTPW